MQIVIDIPEDFYNEIKTCGITSVIHKAVVDGIPLPKGHGRLIDADVLKEEYKSGNWDLHKVLNNVPTIIEADCENCDNANKCYQELGYCNTKMERDEKAVTLTADELAQIFADMVR